MLTNYIINSKDTWKTKRKLGFGYIIQCNAGDNFGIIYGVQTHNIRFNKYDWLYHFEKECNYELPQMTVVSFIRIYDDYSEKEEIVVSDIVPLYTYSLVDDHENINEKKRDDQLYHSSLVWDKMKSHSKMIVIDDNSASLYFPYLSKNDRTVYYLTEHFYNLVAPKHIVEYYICLKRLEPFKDALPFEKTANTIKSFINKVDGLDIRKESKLFEVWDEGYFMYRPGRDDQFIYSKSRISKCDDIYINSLVELGVIEKDYYSCVGRGEGDDDYQRLNEEDTKNLREEVIFKYDKDRHIEYLLKDFVFGIEEKQNEYLSFLQKIKEQGDTKIIQSYLALNYNLDEWKRHILKFNKI